MLWIPRCSNRQMVILATGFVVICTSCRSSNVVQGIPSSNTRRLEPTSAPSLQGAWRLVETAVRLTGQPWDVRPAPQGGLFLFSSQHYSYFYIRGAEARTRFKDANRPSEAERAATYDSFVAGAGGYSYDGQTALLHTDFRKNPNEMTGEVWRWETEASADTLRFIFKNPPFLPGRDWRLTLVRIE